MFDLAINHGLVIDPANRVQSKLHIGIQNGLIACLSLVPLTGKTEIDAEGLIVAPGFVDMHMHEDAYDPQTDSFAVKIFDCMLRMGVTTAIGGNCGIGPSSPVDYLAAADRVGLPVNVGLFAAHNEVRRHWCQDKYATVSAQVAESMAETLGDQLAAGCIGVSFGLRYVPGTSWEELQTLSAVAGRNKKKISVHARDDAAFVLGAFQELIDTAKQQQVRLLLSHIGSMAAFGQMEQVLAMVDHACVSGAEIGMDCYPYTAFCTAIGSTTYDAGFLERYGIGYEAVEITGGPYRGQRCNEAIFREVRKETPEILAVAHVMREAEIDLALSHPRVAMASDGILVDGFGHPRAAGSFPRFIAEYVRKKRCLTLYDAIRKMTALPAEYIGIAKGSLSVGADADVVLFDAAKIADAADFAAPLQEPKGIERVIIGGEVALGDGEIIRRNLGKSVRI